MTDTNDQLLSDEEIDYFLATEGGVIAAAAASCEAVASRFSREADAESGDAAVQLSQRAKMYTQRAKELKRKQGLFDAKPLMPARSIDDKDTEEDDSDRVDPFFRRGIHDNERES